MTAAIYRLLRIRVFQWYFGAVSAPFQCVTFKFTVKIYRFRMLVNLENFIRAGKVAIAAPRHRFEIPTILNRFSAPVRFRMNGFEKKWLRMWNVATPRRPSRTFSRRWHGVAWPPPSIVSILPFFCSLLIVSFVGIFPFFQISNFLFWFVRLLFFKTNVKIIIAVTG